MATARFRASVVRDHAARFIEDQERQRKEARGKKIAKLLETPKTTGSLWWKRTHYRTPAEAEADYRGSGREWYSSKYLAEHKFSVAIRNARPILEIAQAASDLVSDGFVALSDGEARHIGLAQDSAQ